MIGKCNQAGLLQNTPGIEGRVARDIERTTPHQEVATAGVDRQVAGIVLRQRGVHRVAIDDTGDRRHRQGRDGLAGADI